MGGYVVMAFWLAILIGIPAYFAYHSKPATSAHVCKGCHLRVTPKMRTPGSSAITLILSVFLIVPGIIYAIWRHSARVPVCPVCGEANPIPADSPAALALFN